MSASARIDAPSTSRTYTLGALEIPADPTASLSTTRASCPICHESLIVGANEVSDTAINNHIIQRHSIAPPSGATNARFPLDDSGGDMDSMTFGSTRMTRSTSRLLGFPSRTTSNGDGGLFALPAVPTITQSITGSRMTRSTSRNKSIGLGAMAMSGLQSLSGMGESRTSSTTGLGTLQPFSTGDDDDGGGSLQWGSLKPLNADDDVHQKQNKADDRRNARPSGAEMSNLLAGSALNRQPPSPSIAAATATSSKRRSAKASSRASKRRRYMNDGIDEQLDTEVSLVTAYDREVARFGECVRQLFAYVPDALVNHRTPNDHFIDDLIQAYRSHYLNMQMSSGDSRANETKRFARAFAAYFLTYYHQKQRQQAQDDNAANSTAHDASASAIDTVKATVSDPWEGLNHPLHKSLSSLIYALSESFCLNALEMSVLVFIFRTF